MRIDKPSDEQRRHTFSILEKRIAKFGEPIFTKYLSLGAYTVRLINCSHAFTHHIELQLGCTLKDNADHYDTTLVVWQDDVAEIALSLQAPYIGPARHRQLRVAKIMRQVVAIEDFMYFDDSIWPLHNFVEVLVHVGILSAYDPKKNTYYYAVENLEPEEFIRHGHIFVQTFNKILKSPTSNLGHGAVVGLQDKGVLLCGIGYRGKSTFAVNALLDGFDYVSDDYLVLGKDGDVLRSWPIYSIITLSPVVYKSMYARLNATFVSNNARKDKYVFNIANYHDQFKMGYPIKLCMYPVFVDTTEPSIALGGKNKAVQELVLSTVRQMGDLEDVITVSKLYGFVEGLPFYQFNLTKNIDKNTQCLRKFLEQF